MQRTIGVAGGLKMMITANTHRQMPLAINNFLELCLPLAKNWWSRRGNKEATADNQYTRWEKVPFQLLSACKQLVGL